jgi:hypothetical protein
MSPATVDDDFNFRRSLKAKRTRTVMAAVASKTMVSVDNI